MHTWVRRGLQTALVTGGLLMLGTGIASASENVNPDTPANPIDAAVGVPVNIDQNSIGTPAGPVDAPPVQQNVSTADVTGPVTDQAAPLTGQLAPSVGQAGVTTQDLGLPTGDVLRGNKVVVNGIIPIDICGNAIAAGGDASVTGSCDDQSAYAPDPVHTSGANSALAGNAAVANWALPVQATGDAIGALGHATTNTTASQYAYNGGDISTDGTNGVLSGTIAAAQLATPVQASNNAVAGGGLADAYGNASSQADSDGTLNTTGANGTGAGTAGGVPVALPVQLNGNAVGGAGNANSASGTTANAKAGDSGASNLDWAGRPMWLITNGDPSTASGTVAQAPVSGPVSLDDNAASGIGNTTASSTNNSTDTAGGASSTLGTGSVGSGSVANAPVALPTQGAGNSVSAVGNSTATHTDNVASTAGGSTFSLGNNSVLSSTSATVPPAGAVDVCGNGAGGAGSAGGTCTNNVTSTSGGYTGTSGTGSIGSGTIGSAPIAAPVEGYGAAAGAAGTGSASASETKQVSSGGHTNGSDDDGVGSVNVVQTPVALPAQAFGDTAALVGNAYTTTSNNSAANAGGLEKSAGKNATASGNLVQVPASLPTQVFGDTDTVAGNGGTQTDSATSSMAGGQALTDGSGGSVSGNVVDTPITDAGQVFGQAGSVVGRTNSEATNVTSSNAGSDIDTHGDGGSLSGNVVTGDVMPIVQGYGADVAGVANSKAHGDSVSMLTGGGHADTSGVASTASGNVLDIPALAQASPYGDAVSALGNSKGTADNTLTAMNGGNSSTHGDGSLSAYNFLVPVDVPLTVQNTPVPVAGRAVTAVTNDVDIVNGDGNSSEFGLPVSGSALPVNLADVPNGSEVAPLGGFPAAGLPGMGGFSGVLPLS